MTMKLHYAQSELKLHLKLSAASIVAYLIVNRKLQFFFAFVEFVAFLRYGFVLQ